ncbi:putative mitochondrial hypothetical protein [Leptomonas pyrrhocoris]|uniref:Uncharacterized protein n=1 Tax=Leptomonas pyrrhocoris TaxID=157538 RepID=A0A0N0VGV7_LEPPY|nr:putative mitochondrial hypothetical protein [Leptomonas pyrrhocoris]XP_015662560.1 putative mitochondrial hypothetical protein [Leptomonas pyrrhocoris]KPA84120.1 putative mitochondrial hypothetical protein [Leptomonas pyrrhocoris]KPA84121.1 putative mitochondrial hypothetical protein [Leptomonas pyrrhocoris]|eukprot:XP_015662559.1 putative mitochondrial hypothetical protein [Leptomonas pyrrhocoris]
MHRAPPSLLRGTGACVAVPHRSLTRGIPYAPQGTIQDFTSSPRHVQLAKLQHDLDKAAGRPPTGLYDGPTLTTRDGPQPLFAKGTARNPRYGPSVRGGPSPPLPHLPHFSVQSAAREQMLPPRSDNYQQDLRRDPSQAGTPEHIVAARQRIMTMQSDSFGESPRGMVAPPPPLDPDAPREYRAPRVHLDDSWWMLMWAFVILFVLMAKFGK